MANYIDPAGLRARFGAEVDELIGADPGAVPPVDGDTGKLATACADATARIDGYLATRYTLPLAFVPSIVAGWAADVARFLLWDDRAPEEVRKRYEDALAALKLCAGGTISLPPGSDGAKPATPMQFGGYSAPRVFTADSLRGF